MYSNTVVSLPIEKIKPNAGNPRKSYDENSIKELAESIQNLGILQPIMVRPIGPDEDPIYEIVYGYRRYTAAQLAGLKEIPAMVQVLADSDVSIIQITENLQREDVHPMDEALAIAKLRDDLRLNLEDISRILGRSKTYIANRERLLELIPGFRQLLEEGIIPISHALVICKLESDIQEVIYENSFKDRDKWWNLPTIKQLNASIERHSGQLSDATWALDDNSFDHAGPCTSCQFNTANSMLFPDLEEPICTKIKCFNLKKVAVIDRKLAEIKEDPTAILVASAYQISSPLIAKIQREGTEVKNLRDDFENYEWKPEAPQAPDPKQYDLEDEDGKAEYESDMESYNSDLEEYHNSIREYEENLKSGLWLNAFKINPDGEIEELIVKPKSDTTIQDGEAGQASDDSKARAINAQISELQDKVQRQSEIALERIYDSAKKIFGNQEVFNYVLSPEPLNEDEHIAMFMAIFSSCGYAFRDEISENIANKFSYKRDGLFTTYEAISKLTEAQQNLLIRAFIYTHLQPSLNKDSGVESFSSATAFVRVVKSFFPTEMEEISIQEHDKAKQKIVKIQAKIEELQSQLIND